MSQKTTETKPITVRKAIDLERVLAFSGGPFATHGWPKANIHTDPGTAARTGISELVISGHQVEGYVVSALATALGEKWSTRGSLRVKFVRPVTVGEKLEIRIVTSNEDADTRSLDIEVAGDEKGIASVGQATIMSDDEIERVKSHLQYLETSVVKERLDQSQLAVGDRYAPYEFVVSRVLDDQYRFAMDEVGRSSNQPALSAEWSSVHPAALLNTANITKSASHYAPPGTHSMFARDELAFLSLAGIGERLQTDCVVTDVFERRNRVWHSVDAVVRGEKGRIVLWRRTTGALQTAATPIATARQ